MLHMSIIKWNCKTKADLWKIIFFLLKPIFVKINFGFFPIYT